MALLSTRLRAVVGENLVPIFGERATSMEKWSRINGWYAGAMGVSLVGLADSIYLTVQHLTGQSVRCTIVAGCSAVLASRYAAIGGIPTAAYGAVAYFLAFSLATWSLFGESPGGGWAGKALSALALLMGSATLWLLYLQAFVLRAFCSFCLLSAAASLTLVLLSQLGWRRARWEG
jgi:uncharacterized membrane protein